MLLRRTLVASALAALVAANQPIALSDNAPLLGPSFLANFDPTNAEAIERARSAFPGLVEDLFEDGSLNRTDIIFNIDVFSAATNKSIFSYNHVGESAREALTSGELNENSISRLGSVTKMFTVYALIVQGGIDILNQPLTNYLPELRVVNASVDPRKTLNWDGITVGALASHQAGIGGVMDLLQEYPDELTALKAIEYFRDTRHPVTSPYRSAIYADGGFTLLTEVLARLSGRPYGEAVREMIFEPLGMKNTSAEAPETSPELNAVNRTKLGVVTTWAADSPVTAGSGGIYSTNADLRAAGLSILNSELLSPLEIQKWMKPMSGTGSLVELVGAPWEITRLLIPTSDGSNKTRISDLYLKAGGTGDYSSIFALSPDHGIGYSINVAASVDHAGRARWPLRNLVGETFIPAAEDAAFQNAKRNLAGTFAAEGSETTNITLTVDESKPGLGLESFFVEGEDARGLFNALGEPKDTYRLYPTTTDSIQTSLTSLYQAKGTVRVSHRVVGQSSPPASRATIEGGEGGLFDNTFVWLEIAAIGNADEVVLEIVDGHLMTVTMTAVETVLKRIN